MSKFNPELAEQVAIRFVQDQQEKTLLPGFVCICEYLSDFPDGLSWRGKEKPSVTDKAGLMRLAARYFEGYRRSDFPAEPETVPDDMVSVIMREAYGYTDEECAQIKLEHQYSMCAENCVGNLLERYLDSKLRSKGWIWCCGEFVKAVDFIAKTNEGTWVALQIKNRDNSENSSSSAIRAGTKIEKWFRSYSKDTKRGRPSMTNWDGLPRLMQGYGLSEEGFKEFVVEYLEAYSP
jgi:hypothetical protein